MIETTCHGCKHIDVDMGEYPCVICENLSRNSFFEREDKHED